MKDPIARENPKGPYVNLIAVRSEDKDKPWVKALVESYHSPEVKEFVEEKFKGAVLTELVEARRILNRTSLNWPGAFARPFLWRGARCAATQEIRPPLFHQAGFSHHGSRRAIHLARGS